MDNSGMPVFVRIENYKEVLDVMNMIKNKLEDAKKTLARINELKNREDGELDEWRIEMGDVEKKIDFIDHILFEPESV